MTLKYFFKKLINNTIWYLNKISLFKFINNKLIDISRQNLISINHNNHLLKFFCPNPLVQYRISSFSTKEPETLAWIDKFPENSVFWDIGANIGLYSCYAALAKNCSVFAFEPSVFNLDLLARNIYANNLAGKICIIPLPLSNKIIKNAFNMSSTEYGGAHSTFEHNYGQDGLPINNVFSFTTIGITIDESISLLNLPPPNFIKLDVDGIEHLILEGAHNTLRHVDGVLIELNSQFSLQTENANKYLIEAGLQLISKGSNFNSEYLEDFSNQVWARL